MPSGVRADIAQQAVITANQLGLEGKKILSVQVHLQQSGMDEDRFYFQLKEGGMDEKET